jgi:short-subunit dehydrogenase
MFHVEHFRFDALSKTEYNWYMPANLGSAPRVLITGASSGIGAAAAIVFAEAGYDVVIVARRAKKLMEIEQSLRTRFPKQSITHAECDVSSDESVAQLFKRIAQEKSGLHVLVCNAGYGVYGSVEEVPIGDFRQNMETNFLGVIRCVKGALPLLRQAAVQSNDRRGASIVMVSSIVGRRSMPKLASYCASKFALEALSESLRVELRDERIAVSVINPGVTKTDFADAAVGKRPGSFISSAHAMTSEAVARVILKAVEHPKRNRYLTLYGKLCVFLQWLSPKVLDAILLRAWRKANKRSPTQ